MRYIHKPKNALLPVEFTKWLTSNKKKIEDDIADENVKGAELWAFFRNDGNTAYNALKNHIVKEQGCICCYCGQRIENDRHTAIEHLQPKSCYKNKTFNYKNLIASCRGGSVDKIHIVQKGETLLSIEENYEVDIEHLMDVYVNTDELKIFRKKYDLENLSVNDRIVIIPLVDKKSQHCDIKKGGKKEIDIHPLQDNCADYFSYNSLDGKIFPTNDNEKTVCTLGLNNNRYINQLRKKTIDSAFLIKTNLIEEFGHSRALFAENLQNIINNLDDLNRLPNNKLEAFVFVKIWSLLS